MRLATSVLVLLEIAQFDPNANLEIDLGVADGLNQPFEAHAGIGFRIHGDDVLAPAAKQLVDPEILDVPAVGHAHVKALLVEPLSLALGVALGLGVQEPEPTSLPQTQSWRIASFLEDAGLTERVIFDLAFQPDGTIWVAASDGLYRSHGYAWRRFTSAEGLPSDHVRSLLYSSQGDLWVGTEAGAGIFDEEVRPARGARVASGSARF